MFPGADIFLQPSTLHTVLSSCRPCTPPPPRAAPRLAPRPCPSKVAYVLDENAEWRRAVSVAGDGGRGDRWRLQPVVLLVADKPNEQGARELAA
jgi:hypothetical protein